MTSILFNISSWPPHPTVDDQWRLPVFISEYCLVPNMGSNWHIMNHVWNNTTIWNKGMSFWYKNETIKVEITVILSLFSLLWSILDLEHRVEVCNNYLADKIAYHHHHQLLWFTVDNTWKMNVYYSFKWQRANGKTWTRKIFTGKGRM